MKGAIYENFKGEISIESLPVPECLPGSVIIEVKACGICRSDWHGWMGHEEDIVLPHVPGHEFAGEIVEAGKNIVRLKSRDRVVVPFCCGCGACELCRKGKSHICNHYFQPGFTSWGSFAEFVRIDYADFNVQILPESISFVVAASLGCRFITAFRAVTCQAAIQPGQSLAVFGCGGVGLSAIMVAKAAGAFVIALDVHEGALEKAREIGTDAIINSSGQENIPEQVKKVSNGGVHISIDAFGSMDCCIQSILSLRKNGKHIQVGLLNDGNSLPQNILSSLIANELEIIGSHGMPVNDYPAIFKSMTDHELEPSKLIQGYLNLSEGAIFLQKMNEFKHSGLFVITEFR